MEITKMKYLKKPITVDAVQWFKEGDHPAVWVDEWKIDMLCNVCNKKMSSHGEIKTLEGTLTVCPGDWIITGVKGEVYPCKDYIFKLTYDLYDDGITIEC